MKVVECHHLEKSYGGTPVIRGLSLEFSQGEQCAIQGASGSGKSTLLYMLGGLDRPDKGQIIVNDMDLAKLSDEELATFRNKSVGFVFQFHFLLPSMNCLDNILLPAKIGGFSLGPVKKHVLSIANSLGVEHCLKKYPYQLSGGEQQRINIIRALSLRPKILLCDEPTGNLDSKNSKIVTELLSNLARELESTLVVVTHDANVAAHFERKITIEDGQIIS